MEIESADRVVSAPEWRDEIEVLSPERIRVAALDRLGGVAPGMIDWWFGRMDEETYHRFHPVDHKAFAWVRGKEPGRHVGATHLAHHCYGGAPPLLRTEISFVPPEQMLDVSAFAAFDVGAAVCAVVHALDDNDRPHPHEAARFLHVAVRRGYGTELRSCWWLNLAPGGDVDVLTNGRLRHVHEEFAYLTGFLPALHASEGHGT
ncbi:DAPG hydrolase family protein [Streptomyces sp. NPDC059373]